jgi:hypothetical protein
MSVIKLDLNIRPRALFLKKALLPVIQLCATGGTVEWTRLMSWLVLGDHRPGRCRFGVFMDPELEIE